MMAWSDGDFAWWFAMGAMMIALWGALFGFLVWVVARLRPRDEAPDPNREAEAILAERFARGEIDADEFASDREVLHGHLVGYGS